MASPLSRHSRRVTENPASRTGRAGRHGAYGSPKCAPTPSSVPVLLTHSRLQTNLLFCCERSGSDRPRDRIRDSEDPKDLDNRRAAYRPFKSDSKEACLRASSNSCNICSPFAGKDAFDAKRGLEFAFSSQRARMGNISFEEVRESRNAHRQFLVGRIVQCQPELRRLPLGKDLLQRAAR